MALKAKSIVLTYITEHTAGARLVGGGSTPCSHLGTQADRGSAILNKCFPSHHNHLHSHQ